SPARNAAELSIPTPPSRSLSNEPPTTQICTLSLHDALPIFTDGEKFDAEAVKANFDRIIDSEGSINGYKSLRNVEDIEVVDDYEVKITLDDTNSQFLDKVRSIRMASPKALEDDD